MKHNDGSDHSRANTDLIISWGKNKYVRAGSAPETKEVPEKPKVPYRLEMPEVPHGSERPEVPHGSERPEVPHGSERPEVPRRAAGSSEPEIPRRTSRSSGPEPAEKGSRAILAGCNTGTDAGKYARAMAELRGLAEACGLKAVSVLVQNAPAVTHATYIGSGKVLELKKEVEEFDADIVLFNEALTPMQTRNLEKVLDTEVLDRTGLILQIFALRARTREAKLQVESAQLQYMLPRLAGMRTNLSRQGGGSGRLSNKGAGEQKLELDRRRIEHRIAELRRELDVVSRERATQRNRRMRTGMTRVALVGYTNAGKSTVMNALLKYCAGTSGSGTGSFSPADRNPFPGPLKNTDPAGKSLSDSAARRSFKDPSNISGPLSRDRMSSPDTAEQAGGKTVFEADMLFATLDTSVRRIDAPGHIPFLLSDTVGFVSDLPHALVKAFRSTLDEVCCADLLLEVVDFSDPDYRRQIEVTARTLEDIGAGHIPVVYLYNKVDLALREEASEKDRPVPLRIPYRRGEILYLAAGKKIGIPDILTLIDDALEEGRTETGFLIPYKKGALLQEIRSCGVLLSEEYLPEGIRVRARCRREDALRISRLCAE